MGFYEVLGVETVFADKKRVEVTMPITPDLYQPFGFLHGGVTLALLETAASIGAELNTNFEEELPFGIDVSVRHRKSGKEGMLRAEAILDREEPSFGGVMKQYWSVVAYDDAGDVVSDGIIMTKIVPLSRLAEKQAQRAAQQ